MKPVMYLLANKALGMSYGKFGAQCGHAAVRAWLLSEPPIKDEWLAMGETKIVLEARDTEHLLVSREYIESRGFATHLVIDEGRTEIAPHTPTVLGVEIVDKQDDNVAFTFGDFKVYKEDKPEPPPRGLLDFLGKK